MAKMEDKFKNLPLRKGVGIIVLNEKNKVFVAKRIDNPKNFWQMPQGGVDEGEDFLSAAYRELEEETSIKNVKLIKENFYPSDIQKDIDKFLTELDLWHHDQISLTSHTGKDDWQCSVGKIFDLEYPEHIYSKINKYFKNMRCW